MLYVCDENFNRLGIVGKFSYLLWRKRYSSHGEAELHVDVTIDNINLLKKGHILFRKDDSEAMFIYYRGFDETEDGKEQLIIKCFSSVRWLDRRILWGKYNYEDTPENIIRSMITSECINPSKIERKIPQIKLADAKNLGAPIKMQSLYQELLEQVESLCNTYEIGIRTNFNGKSLFYEVYEGHDRTVNQSENPRCILSKSFSNVVRRNFEEADNDFKNTVLIAGAGEGNARKITAIEQGDGLDRREFFVDARDIQDTKRGSEEDIPIPESEYMLLLRQRGLQKLLEHEEFISFDCEIDVTRENTKYNEDFFLGDLITIRDDKLGIIMNSRVVEVDEVYQTHKEIFVKVGKSVPTLPEKVRKMVTK
ncbi:siphovirus ReqiPepy6 Gp37-like family protein [Bacillus sp. NPDC094106]|uniref:siphovirus ReqiPepy6 Gp37-like family protein n=1 Tax=Bacillus sp. NPDC094106 TaxID=3363949 RepID=UPI0038130BA6